MMAVTYRLKSSQLSSRRIDPWHYQPEFFKKIAKVYSGLGGNELAVLIDNERGVAGGATPLGAEYLSNGRVRFYRTSEVDELQIDFENAVYISDEDDEKLQRSRLKDGDVLLTITGAKFGKSAVVNETHLPGNISQHSVRFFPKPDELDPYFLVAYMNGVTGQIAIWREAYGATRPAIDFPGVRSLVVPIVGNIVQKYIGDKVRQAERLRAWAKASIANADELIAEKFKHQLANSMTKHPRRLPTKLLSTISLGPEFARATEGQDTFVDSSPLAKFTEYCKCGDPIRSEDRVTGIYPYYGASGPFDVHDEFNFDGEFLVVAQDGSIGCANVARGKIWANNHVWVIKVKSEYDLDAICRFLSQHFPYWKGVTTGSVVPKVTSENLLRVKVPDLIATDIAVGEYLRSANLSIHASISLTNAAKLLVEALIEGQLTEAELIATERALQTGNDQLDRQILNRLKTDGIDGQGQALFSDLDQLYSLLQQ